MGRPRLIPVITILNNQAVKTKKFAAPRYVGDPVNTISLLSSYEVQELLVLDISGSHNSEPAPNEILSQIAENAFMPIGFGGGIRNFADAKRIFEIGFDKIILKNKLFDSNLVHNIIEKYGIQAVTGCIDVSYPENDQKKLILNEVEYAIDECRFILEKIAQSGIGELIIQDIDRDGTREGLRDHPFLNYAIKQLEIPVVPLGGARTMEEASNFLNLTKCHSIAASTMFLFHPKREAVLISYPSIEKWQNSHLEWEEK